MSALGGLKIPAAVATTRWLTCNTQFNSWFEYGYSRLLLVKCCITSKPVRALSLFSATLLLNVYTKDHTVSLYYFCNVADSDASSGLHVLLRSLIAQILVKHRCDTVFLLPQSVGAIACFERDVLWDLFATLIKSLHGKVVYCIVDGLDGYIHRREAEWLLQKLPGLVKECNGNCNAVLKVLITDPIPMEDVDSIYRYQPLITTPAPRATAVHMINIQPQRWRCSQALKEWVDGSFRARNLVLAGCVWELFCRQKASLVFWYSVVEYDGQTSWVGEWLACIMV